jgi:hypothetical protein
MPRPPQERELNPGPRPARAPGFGAGGPEDRRSGIGQDRGGAPQPSPADRGAARGRGGEREPTREGGTREGGFLPATTGYGASKLNSYGDPV